MRVHACACVCIGRNARLSLRVSAPVSAWVAWGEGPSRSRQAGYVKEQPELPRASHRPSAEVAAGTGATVLPAPLPRFPPPRRSLPGTDAGALGGETRQRLSSGPAMARLSGAGWDTLAGGEAAGGSPGGSGSGLGGSLSPCGTTGDAPGWGVDGQEEWPGVGGGLGQLRPSAKDPLQLRGD